MPVAHDAFTAKIIEDVGFEAFSIGGFGVAASSYAKPDNGSLVFEDFYPVYKNIINAVDIPVLVDADTGYGGPKKAAKVVKAYEKIGASAMFIEDQKWPKRCGHTNGHKIISTKDMCNKINACKKILKEETILMARTDAISAEGSIENAIKRGKEYKKAGADALFIEAPQTLADIKRIPREFPDTILLINMMEGGKTPMLGKKEIEKLGYHLIAYPITSILSYSMAVKKAMRRLKKYGTTNNYYKKNMMDFGQFKQIIKL